MPVFCCPKPLFQSEAKCEAIDMKTSIILIKMKLIFVCLVHLIFSGCIRGMLNLGLIIDKQNGFVYFNFICFITNINNLTLDKASVNF